MAEVGSHSARRTAARKMSLVLKMKSPSRWVQQIARSSLSDARRSQQNEPPASFSALGRTLAPDCSSLQPPHTRTRPLPSAWPTRAPNPPPRAIVITARVTQYIDCRCIRPRVNANA